MNPMRRAVTACVLVLAAGVAAAALWGLRGDARPCEHVDAPAQASYAWVRGLDHVAYRVAKYAGAGAGAFHPAISRAGRAGTAAMAGSAGGSGKPPAPVVFLHGHVGSYEQGRTLGRLLARANADVDVYVVDLAEEAVGLSGAILSRQADFARQVIGFVSRAHGNASVVVVGHSMGAVVGWGAIRDLRVSTFLALCAPLARPIIAADAAILRFYRERMGAKTANHDLATVSLACGRRDALVPANLCELPRDQASSLHALASSIHNMGFSVDHQAIVSCDRVAGPIAAAISFAAMHAANSTSEERMGGMARALFGPNATLQAADGLKRRMLLSELGVKPTSLLTLVFVVRSSWTRIFTCLTAVACLFLVDAVFRARSGGAGLDAPGRCVLEHMAAGESPQTATTTPTHAEVSTLPSQIQTIRNVLGHEGVDRFLTPAVILASFVYQAYLAQTLGAIGVFSLVAHALVFVVHILGKTIRRAVGVPRFPLGLVRVAWRPLLLGVIGGNVAGIVYFASTDATASVVATTAAAAWLMCLLVLSLFGCVATMWFWRTSHSSASTNFSEEDHVALSVGVFHLSTLLAWISPAYLSTRVLMHRFRARSEDALLVGLALDATDMVDLLLAALCLLPSIAFHVHVFLIDPTLRRCQVISGEWGEHEFIKTNKGKISDEDDPNENDNTSSNNNDDQDLAARAVNPRNDNKTTQVTSVAVVLPTSGTPDALELYSDVDYDASCASQLLELDSGEVVQIDTLRYRDVAKDRNAVVLHFDRDVKLAARRRSWKRPYHARVALASSVVESNDSNALLLGLLLCAGMCAFSLEFFHLQGVSAVVFSAFLLSSAVRATRRSADGDGIASGARARHDVVHITKWQYYSKGGGAGVRGE